MEDHSQSPEPSNQEPAPTNMNAHAEEQFMLPLRPNMDDVPVEKFDVSDASERLDDSEEFIPADPDADPTCKVCEKERLSEGLAPRIKVQLSQEITANWLFEKDDPIWACPSCDGTLVERSWQAYS